MVEEEGKKEDQFGFTPEGEALGYISLDQARVLAMRTARETPGVYGRRFRNVPMAFEVAAEEQTEDHYVVTLSFRPQGEFTGTQGQEQFFIEKEGVVALRQVLSLPQRAGERRLPVVPVAIGLVAVVIAVVVGVVFAVGSGGVDDGIEDTASTSASLPPANASPVIPAGAVPAVTAAPTPTGMARPAIAVPTSISGAAGGLRRGVTISGRVSDADTGLSLANVRINAENTQDGPSTGTSTDADGRYTIRGVAPGSYHIRAEADDQNYISQFYDDQVNPDTADLFTISGSAPVVGIDFGLRLGTSISGRVTDGETGLPIADMDVHAGPVREGGHLSWTRTDRNGEYVTRGLPNGVMEVSVEGQTYIMERTTVTISEAGVVLGVDLALKLGATFSGRVTDADTGLSPANVRINAENTREDGPKPKIR